MNKFEAFAGGALLGGLDVYGKLQEEERKFKIDQLKQDAEYNRQVNFARFKQKMETVGIGLDGMEVSREQLEAMSPEERAKVKGKLEAQHDYDDSKMTLGGRPLTRAEYNALSPEERAKAKAKDTVDFEQAQALQAAQIAAADRRHKESEANAERRYGDAQTKEDARIERAKTLQLEKDLDVAQKQVIGIGPKVTSAYDKGELKSLSGRRALDTQVYTNLSRIQAMDDIRMTLPAATYEKFATSNTELKKVETMRRVIEAAQASDNPLTFLNSDPTLKSNPELREQMIYMMKAQGTNFLKYLKPADEW
jgi:hypothetical protein